MLAQSTCSFSQASKSAANSCLACSRVKPCKSKTILAKNLHDEVVLINGNLPHHVNISQHHHCHSVMAHIHQKNRTMYLLSLVILSILFFLITFLAGATKVSCLIGLMPLVSVRNKSNSSCIFSH